MTIRIFFGLSLICFAAKVNAQEEPVRKASVAAVPQTHAHNDYLHARPLLDALEQGFVSVEADIFLTEDQLLVAHTQGELQKAKPLDELYLKPLQVRVTQNAGSVYGDGKPFTLLIDLKTDGQATYRKLHQLLSEYSAMLTKVENGQVTPGAVTIVISGNRPIDFIANQPLRFAGIDGRLSDLESDKPAHLMPLISDNWGQHFKWDGKGEISAEELSRLKSIVERTHDRDRRIRFWAIPDNVAAWQVMYDAGVDLINTDDLNGLSDYLKSR